jgi:hypothetical protein
MTPWQEVRALAEKWREDASHADEAAAATDNLLLDAEIYGAAVAKRACASELDVLIRDPAFIGMMEDAARWRFYASSPQTALMLGSTKDPNSGDMDQADWYAESSSLADTARASSAGEGGHD